MKVTIYDTTLRDGTQGEGVAFSARDKIRVAELLDDLGIDYVEGGWPGSNPRDADFFRSARALKLKHARISAFGSTCHPKYQPEQDPNLKALLEAETPTVTIFGKSWDLHVTKALGITLDQNLELIRASVAYLKSKGREVIYDAEHFFDGYRSLPEYALSALQAAEEGGADWIVLCDTNGGTLTSRVSEVVADVTRLVKAPLGIHAHNDSDLAVANSIAAVTGGARQVQGTINGYGERCGNANLCSIVPILELKLGRCAVGLGRLATLTTVSKAVAEVANMKHPNQLPFVGKSAFAHKGGVHVSAVMSDPATYEHIVPEMTGNSRRVLVSDLSGKSNIVYKAEEMGVELDGDRSAAKPVVAKIKQLENEGYEYEAAEASLRLLIEEARGARTDAFKLEEYRVVSSKQSNGSVTCEATVRVDLDGNSKEATAHGTGPVHALDQAIKVALKGWRSCLDAVRLCDYKVRVLDVLDQGLASASRVRVLVQTSDGESVWGTVGVSNNIVEASCQALADAINYRLLFDLDDLDAPAESGRRTPVSAVP
ncbi:MAG TPA: citramalate synthase [Blastocatellia bacterium]|nr:citramalate synthase [Blastocatellia bacterium]